MHGFVNVTIINVDVKSVPVSARFYDELSSKSRMMRRKKLLAGTGFLLALFFSSALGTDISKTDAVKMTDVDRLLEELFKRRHYNPSTPPSQRVNDVVDVILRISAIQLSKIDDLNEVMEMLLWIIMDWTDFRLAWNESDYDGLSRITVPFSKIWTPDIVLMNSATRWNKLTEVNIGVTSDGVCQWVSPTMTVSYCPIDVQWFPFDEQKCLLEFESWSYDSSKLNLTASGVPIIETEFFRENCQWHLMGISYNNTMIKYPCCVHLSSHPKFTFHWRRRTLFYGFNLILPCTLLAALSAVTFIIPPQCGERIKLGISTLLAMSVNQLMVADRVPPTSDAIPLIAIYFVGVMTVNALSLMAMVGISNLYHRSSTNLHPMPRWVKTFVCIRLGKLLRMPKRTRDRGTKDVADCPKVKPNLFSKEKATTATMIHHDLPPPIEVEDEQSQEGDDVICNDDWKYAALVIDRLCFFVCTLCLATITLAVYACVIVIRSDGL